MSSSQQSSSSNPTTPSSQKLISTSQFPPFGDRRPLNSKEDLLQKVSKSIFATNFPDHFSTRDLWIVCVAYGKVVDVYILLKKSKAGKKFAFVRFLKVDNLDSLIDNLCIIWIGRLRLHANHVRFQRESKVYSSQPKKGNDGFVKSSFASVLKSGNQSPSMAHDSAPAIVLDDSYSDSITLKEKIRNHVGVASWFQELLPASDSFVSDDRIVWVSVEGLPIKTLTRNTFAKIVSPWGELIDVEDPVNLSLSYKKLCVKTRNNVIINYKIKIIVKGQVYWIRVKELEAWTPDLNNDLEDNSTSDDESAFDEAEPISEGKKSDGIAKETEIDHVSKTSYMNENDFTYENHVSSIDKNEKGSQDAFGIYELLNKKDDKVESKGEDPKLGFTPVDANKNVVENNGISTHEPNVNLHSSNED
ncbi:hypothetical protein CTI12_AA093550 [Artemisia annua]|uniref:RRM domain-containing protein n=1 Tax=Artemisia annua TaxID=35608 RepID=A0A2U1PT78_ARTAN|nr:hypothetical protein CTI12_AA093550 [Artemisia annua]